MFCEAALSYYLLCEVAMSYYGSNMFYRYVSVLYPAHLPGVISVSLIFCLKAWCARGQLGLLPNVDLHGSRAVVDLDGAGLGLFGFLLGCHQLQHTTIEISSKLVQINVFTH